MRLKRTSSIDSTFELEAKKGLALASRTEINEMLEQIDLQIDQVVKNKTRSH